MVAPVGGRKARRLSGPFFRDDLTVLGCGHRGVTHIPAKGLEKRVYQRLADMGFLDAGGQEGLAVIGEVPAQLGNFIFALVECLTHMCSILIPV